METPYIAVAGINPHSGEGGLFGDEEVKEIIPAIEEARKRGINAIDRFRRIHYFPGKNGEFDAILAMYHDQGHMPCKTLDLERTVSVTLGTLFYTPVWTMELHLILLEGDCHQCQHDGSH